MAKFSEPVGAMAFRLVSPALLIILAAACSAEQDAATPPAPVIPGPAIQSSAAASAQGPAWSMVSPTKRKRFLAALTAIDRPLSADGSVALAHAVDICFKYYDGTTDEGLRAYTRTAFGGGTTTISPTAARKIVTATKRWICPAGGLHRRWES